MKRNLTTFFIILGLLFSLAGWPSPGSTPNPKLATVSPHFTEISSNRQTAIRNPQLTAWYVNKAEGIEQGFTLAERPGVSLGGEPLRVAVTVTGGLKPSVEDGGQAVTLSYPRVRQALRYDHLAGYDALGWTLQSRMEVAGDEMSLLVEDTAA